MCWSWNDDRVRELNVLKVPRGEHAFMLDFAQLPRDYVKLYRYLLRSILGALRKNECSSQEVLMPDVTPKQALSDALRYWEPRRIVYNVALGLVVMVVFLVKLPSSRSSLSFDLLQGLFVLAVLANVAYCAAHIVDIVLQISAYRTMWLRVRWILLAIGIAFAAVLANFLSRGVFAHGA